MKYAVVNTAISGDNTIVAAVANKRIKVLHYAVGCDQNIDIYWKSNATRITGPIFLAASTSLSAGYGASSPAGLVAMFETGVGEPLVLNLSGAKTVGGHITYLVTD
jgi:hypothetical protein